MSEVDTPEEAPQEEAATDEPTEKDPSAVFSEMIERNNAQMQSWQGRREAALLDKISEMIESKVPKKEEEKPDWFDNPEQAFNQFYERKQQEATAYSMNVQRHLATKMDSKYLNPDGSKSDEGQAVLAEIAEKAKTFDVNKYKHLGAADTAELLLSKAEAGAFKKFAKKAKNPFDGRQPTDKKLGASEGKSQGDVAVSHAQLDPEAQKLAEAFNYSPEKLAKLFPGK